MPYNSLTYNKFYFSTVEDKFHRTLDSSRFTAAPDTHEALGDNRYQRLHRNLRAAAGSVDAASTEGNASRLLCSSSGSHSAKNRGHD